MNTMAPTCLAELQSRRIWLSTDMSRSLPVIPAEAENGRGLLLVATLSGRVGLDRTAGAFTLACQPAPVSAAGGRGDLESTFELQISRPAWGVTWQDLPSEIDPEARTQVWPG